MLCLSTVHSSSCSSVFTCSRNDDQMVEEWLRFLFYLIEYVVQLNVHFCFLVPLGRRWCNWRINWKRSWRSLDLFCSFHSGGAYPFGTWLLRQERSGCFYLLHLEVLWRLQQTHLANLEAWSSPLGQQKQDSALTHQHSFECHQFLTTSHEQAVSIEHWSFSDCEFFAFCSCATKWRSYCRLGQPRRTLLALHQYLTHWSPILACPPGWVEGTVGPGMTSIPHPDHVC